MFLNHLYGGMEEPAKKIIDVFMCKLRKKLANASGGKDYIETVWGRGYVLRHPTDKSSGRRYPPDASPGIRPHERPTMNSDQARQRAEKTFKREQRARDRRKAMN